jgi:ATP-dependent Clp protease protease subunit
MFKLEKLKDKAVLTIYGYVGGLYLDYRAVNGALAEITKDGYNRLDFRLHTYGGTVFDGNLIYNFIAGFGGEVDIYIDGVAASMGSIIMTSGTRVHIADNGFVMIHSPRGSGDGTAKDFINYAKLLRSMEKNFTQRLVARTGMTEEEVSVWFDGTDYWFDADEAVEIGLADDKFEPRIKGVTKFDKTEAAQIGAKAAYERFAALLEESKSNENKNEMNKKDLIDRYKLTGVTADSTDEEVLAAVDVKIKEGEKAQEAARAGLRKSIEAAVDKAIEDKKITKEQKDKYVERGEKLGLDELNAILADVKPYQPVAGEIKGKGGEGSANGEDRSKWTWNDYQQKAQADLEAMPKTDPERFKALYKAEYGSNPE